MKPIRLLLLTAWLGVTAVALSATTSQPETYFAVGYYKGEKPSAVLLEKATAAVAQKVAGMVQTTDTENSDHRIEILFTRGNFEVYVDAIPLSPSHRISDFTAGLPRYDYAMEKADSERSQPH